MLLDGGRTFTKVLIQMSLTDGMDYQRNFADKHRDSLIHWCDHYHIDYRDIFRERDVDEIFWSDYIQFVTPKRIQEWHDMHVKHDYSHGYCLKTNSSSGRCYGCGTCPTPQDIKRIVARELSHIPVEEAIANMAGQRVRTVTRFVINKDVNWKLYSNETLCHYVTSLFLQEKPELVKAFHLVGKNNTSWAANYGQKDWYGGYVICDVEWKDLIYAKELQELVDKVNARLHIAKVVAVYDIDKNLEMDTNCNNSYMVEFPDLSLGRFSERLNNFDWDFKVMEKGGSGEPVVTKKHMPELKERMLFVPYGRGVMGFFNLPVTLNPYLILSSFIGMNEAACRQYDFKVVDVGTESDMVCKTDGCGRYSNFSFLLNKQLDKCPVCRGKLMLYKASQKK